jgi:hypothetical protein
MLVGARAPVHLRLAWTARILMLGLGILSTPSVGLWALQRPHCARHEMAGPGHASEAGAIAHHGDLLIWSQTHDHQCPHCPASECGHAIPCAGASTTPSIPATAVMADFDAHRVALDHVREQASSATSPPDTPPPQLIS